MPNHHSLTRHTAYYLIGRIATGLIGLLTLVAFTRVLSPADYGRYAVVVAVAGLIAGVGFQWLRQCLVRFGTGNHEARQTLLGTLGTLFGFLLLVLLAICIGLALLKSGDVLRVGLSGFEIAAIGGLTAAQAWFEFSTDMARTEFHLWRYGIATFLRALLSLLLGVVAALVTRQVVVVVLAMAVAYFCSSFVTTGRSLLGVFRIRMTTRAEIRRLCLYGLPLAGTLGLTIILGTADRLMLAAMRGYTEAGVYSSAYNLSQFSIGILLFGLGLGSFPLAIRVLDDRGESGVLILLRNNLILGVGIGLPAVVGLIMVAPVLDPLLLGNYVAGSSDVVTMIVAIAAGLGAVESSCVDIVFMLREHTLVQSMIIGSSVLLNVLLNLLLIPRWGAVGAALATLLTFLCAFVASWVLSRRYLRVPVPYTDIGKVVLSCCAMAIVLLIIAMNLERWLRLVLSVACGVAVYSLVLVMLNFGGSRVRLLAFVARR